MVIIHDPRIPKLWHVFRSCEWDTRTKLKNRYCVLKKTGKISGGVICSGASLWGIAKDLAKDVTVYHGKRGVGVAIIAVCGWLCPVPVRMITNSTRVIGVAMTISNSAAATIRICENVADAPLIVCDYFLFGEYVPTNNENSYNLYYTNVTDVHNQITKLGG